LLGRTFVLKIFNTGVIPSNGKADSVRLRYGFGDKTWMRLAGSSSCQKWRFSPVEEHYSNAIGDRARAQVAGMANDWRS